MGTTVVAKKVKNIVAQPTVQELRSQLDALRENFNKNREDIEKQLNERKLEIVIGKVFYYVDDKFNLKEAKVTKKNFNAFEFVFDVEEGTFEACGFRKNRDYFELFESKKDAVQYILNEYEEKVDEAKRELRDTNNYIKENIQDWRRLNTARKHEEKILKNAQTKFEAMKKLLAEK